MATIGNKYYCRRLEGKVAMVTASTSGIGYSIAERLGLEGAVVFVSSRKKDQVEESIRRLKGKGIKVHGEICHVAEEEDRKNFFKMADSLYGGFDILVSCAGLNPQYGNIFNTDMETWDKMFEINVKSTFLLIQEAMPFFDKRGGGSVVIVSSIAAYTPFEAIGAYSISKASLISMVKAMVPQATKQNVRVNAIAPGVIKTKFIHSLWENEKVENETKKIVPMKRLGLPDDCSGVVAFLVSKDASYITGETIVIGGGLPSRL